MADGGGAHHGTLWQTMAQHGTPYHTMAQHGTPGPQAPAPPTGGALQAPGAEGGGGEGAGGQVWLLKNTLAISMFAGLV